MVKAKRFNLSMALVVVLSVMLTLAISIGSTLAWFSDTDFGTTDLNMSGAVLVKLAKGTEDKYATAGGKQVVFNKPAELLQPGMTITPEVYTLIQGSTTNALVRVKVGVDVEWAEGNTAYLYGWKQVGTADSYKKDLEDQEEEAKTAAEVMAIVKKEIEDTFYDSIDASANASGWYRHDGYYYFFGNGEDYSQRMTDPGVANPGGTVTPTQYDEVELANAMSGEATPNNKPTYVLDSTTMLDRLETTKLASVVNLNDSQIPFLVDFFEVPTGWGNETADANITIDITVQAMQDFVIDLADTDGMREQQLPTLNYAIPQFTDAFGA